jgi:hypothetical protein
MCYRLVCRLADHLESCDTFSLKKIKFLVLDEADRLLAGGGGFDKQVCFSGIISWHRRGSEHEEIVEIRTYLKYQKGARPVVCLVLSVSKVWELLPFVVYTADCIVASFYDAVVI